MLAAADRLRRRDEFAATIKSGRRVARGSLVVHLSTTATPNDPDLSDTDPARASGANPSARAGFVVSKAVGNAVIRNQVKRRLRHLVREHLPTLAPGTDLVVRALPAASTRAFPDLAADLAQAIEAASRPRPPRAKSAGEGARK